MSGYVCKCRNKWCRIDNLLHGLHITFKPVCERHDAVLMEMDLAEMRRIDAEAGTSFDFYEDDEDPAKIREQFGSGLHGVTANPAATTAPLTFTAGPTVTIADCRFGLPDACD